MTRRARGFYAEEGGLTAVPRVRLAVGFGPGRVVALSAVVDTGVDVCVFPEHLFPFVAEEGLRSVLQVEGLGGASFAASLHFPSITVGDIREPGVASILVPGAEPLVGRSFLNRCRLRLDPAQEIVRLESLKAS